MRKNLTLTLLGLAALPMFGQPAMSPVKQEIFNTFNNAATKAVNLCKAMPQEKFTWRPAEGIRSVNEVCMHMAGANYWFLTGTALKPPAGGLADLLAVYTKKGGAESKEVFAAEAKGNRDQVAALMQTAFDNTRQFIRDMPDSDLDKQVAFFGRMGTIRGILIALTEHLGEHLGQSIAYARMNKIVPPWSK